MDIEVFLEFLALVVSCLSCDTVKTLQSCNKLLNQRIQGYLVNELSTCKSWIVNTNSSISIVSFCMCVDLVKVKSLKLYGLGVVDTTDPVCLVLRKMYSLEHLHLIETVEHTAKHTANEWLPRIISSINTKCRLTCIMVKVFGTYNISHLYSCTTAIIDALHIITDYCVVKDNTHDLRLFHCLKHVHLNGAWGFIRLPTSVRSVHLRCQYRYNEFMILDLQDTCRVNDLSIALQNLNDLDQVIGKILSNRVVKHLEYLSIEVFGGVSTNIINLPASLELRSLKLQGCYVDLTHIFRDGKTTRNLHLKSCNVNPLPDDYVLSEAQLKCIAFDDCMVHSSVFFRRGSGYKQADL
jgi:hypothetical protein